MAALAMLAVRPMLAVDAEPPPIAVCMRPDRSIRLAEENFCREGERKIGLTAGEDEDEGSEWEEWKPKESRGAVRSDDPLDGLERRIEALEEQPLFEVVRKDGAPILVVRETGTLVYNRAGTAVAALRATEKGGYFMGRTADKRRSATIGGSWKQGGVRILEDEIVRVDLGKQEGGNYALRFPDAADGMLAGIGESKAGTGTLVIGDSSGKRRATLEIGNEGRGAFYAYNEQDTQAASLTESTQGSGLLVLGDATGAWRTKMGVLDNRYGFVLTGPSVLGPLLPATGLPGSYILGCAGGESCLPGGGASD